MSIKGADEMIPPGGVRYRIGDDISIFIRYDILIRYDPCLNWHFELHWNRPYELLPDDYMSYKRARYKQCGQMGIYIGQRKSKQDAGRVNPRVDTDLFLWKLEPILDKILGKATGTTGGKLTPAREQDE